MNPLAAMTLALVSLPAMAADSVGTAATTPSGLQALLGFAVVLALMAAAAWLLRRFGMPRMTGNTPVRIVGGVSVGARERVLVVEAGDQWIVLGVAPGRVNALMTMPRQEPPVRADGASEVKRLLARFQQSAEPGNAK